MAIKFDDLRAQILVVLYDYMLTSDHESFWFSTISIRDGLPPDASGAFVARAIDSLTADKLLERGLSDPEREAENTVTYALTKDGIVAAERGLEKKGWSLADYSPAPSVDLILSRIDNPELHRKIQEGFAEFEKDVRGSNEIAISLGDQKEIILDEISVAKHITSKDNFRVQRLIAYILPALRFVADKFVGSGVSEAAKRLIELLVSVT